MKISSYHQREDNYGEISGRWRKLWTWPFHQKGDRRDYAARIQSDDADAWAETGRQKSHSAYIISDAISNTLGTGHEDFDGDGWDGMELTLQFMTDFVFIAVLSSPRITNR